MREIIRAGIDAIDRGQMEAARSLGMTYGLAMRRIVLPQAARVIVPPLGNEFNSMMKNDARCVFFIGVYEMFADAEIHYSTTFKPVEYFVAVAFWYLVLTTGLEPDPGADRAQARRQRPRRRALVPRARAGGMDTGAGLGARSAVTRPTAARRRARGRRAQELRPARGAEGRRARGRARRGRLPHRAVRARASRPSSAASTTWRRSTPAASR